MVEIYGENLTLKNLTSFYRGSLKMSCKNKMKEPPTAIGLNSRKVIVKVIVI